VLAAQDANAPAIPEAGVKVQHGNIAIAVVKVRAGSLPVGSQILYLCLLCRTCVPSLPRDAVSCFCGNIHIDADEGRADAEHERQFLVLSARSSASRQPARSQLNHNKRPPSFRGQLRIRPG
jgi:hypothetical protein